MLNFIKNFKNDESGAVTVDYVVLTAAIVLLGAVVGASVKTGATTLADKIEADLIAQSGS
tara:strand:+ start:522 stop:701 length:180 start_codon:yes stop_codon:yes gene_type:complete